MQKIILLICVTYCSVACSLKLPQAKINIPDSYVYQNDSTKNAQQLKEKWWLNFCDTTLNALIDSALTNNRNLASSLANLQAARHYLRVAKAENLPSLYFEGILDNSKEEGVISHEYSITPAIAWELSLFGKLKNTKKSAQAKLMAEEWNYKGVRLSLSAQVAKSYFTIMGYEYSLILAQNSYNLRQEATNLVDSLYHYGMSDGIALSGAKSLVYSANLEIIKYRNALKLASLSLDALLGHNPSPVKKYYGEGKFSQDAVYEIPNSLPSRLVERRADVMESYYIMSEKAAGVGISRAERYPSLNLTLSSGLFSTTTAGLTSGNPFTWEIIATLTQPIFNFGKLKANERMAREEYISSVKSYEQTVIDAFCDVEKSLVNINSTRASIASSKELVRANNKVATTTNALYVNGMGDYMSSLEAQREYYSSQISLINYQIANYENYIDLYVALGGGY